MILLVLLTAGAVWLWRAGVRARRVGRALLRAGRMGLTPAPVRAPVLVLLSPAPRKLLGKLGDWRYDADRWCWINVATGETRTARYVEAAVWRR